VSIIFLTPFAGYSLAAFTNSRIHMRWGQRGVGLVAPVCHIAAFATMAAHPPFPVLVALFALSGFGNGLTDAAYCAWAGGMRKSNQILGFMHSCYSLGALCAPLLATSMVVHGGLGWYSFYYVLVGLAVLEWAGLTGLFWEKTGAMYREEHAQEGEREGSTGSGTKQALKSKITWLSAGFIFLFMAVEGKSLSPIPVYLQR
jgi:fucose permease